MTILCGHGASGDGILPDRVYRIAVGLEERHACPLEKRGSQGTEWICMDKAENGIFQVLLNGCKAALPFLSVFFKKPAPPVESPDGDIKAFADLFHRLETQAMFSKDTEDETEAVPAIRNDRVGKHAMGSRMIA